VRNIRVLMPGTHESPWSPVFLNRWRGVACLRFMDWMHTNGSTISRWAERPTLESATFSGKGVALEWMIDLCNELKCDAWFCMPHLADDDYVRSFAAMVKAKLDPKLKVYIEYSNEVWNPQFAQYKYAEAEGRKRGFMNQPVWKFTAQRSVEIFRIWEKEFGGRDRLVRVLPTQAAVGAVSEAILAEAGKDADALAIAPYMGLSVPVVAREGRLTTGEVQDWTVEQVLDYVEKNALPKATAAMQNQKQIAAKHGLKLIAYEGGQHMVAFVQDRDLVARLTETMQQANRHPRMGDLYRRYFDHWSDIGGGTFAVFSSISRWSNHGAWGLAEFYDSQPSEYPKLEAVLQWSRRHGQLMDIPGR
jgi:hypothetical protein